MLDWHGTGMSVMEMSHRGKEFMSIYAETQALYARAAGDPRRLQGAVPAGRRDRPERDRADEPAARKDARRLHQHRRLVASARSPRPSTSARVNVAASGEASGFTAIPPQRRVAPRPGGGVRPHLRQRDDHRPRVPLDARYRRRAAGRRHVVEHPVAADRRQPLRPDLRRRAEEHRPGRADAGHRSRRPARRRADDDAERLQLHRSRRPTTR